MQEHHPNHSSGSALGLAGYGSTATIHNAHTESGPQLDMRAETPQNGLHDPGIGLREHLTRHQRTVLTYGDLKALHPTRDKRQPSREIQLHLTRSMHRYIWSINGVTFTDSAPLTLKYGQRVRINFDNEH